MIVKCKDCGLERELLERFKNMVKMLRCPKCDSKKLEVI